jgi:hypothetical protein
MEDIVERIRKLRFVHIPGTSDLMEEACQEIERLRSGAAEGRETATLADDERDAIERLRTHATHATQTEGSKRNGCTLTDAEREAVAFGIACVTTDKHAATLRKLLERLHT